MHSQCYHPLCRIQFWGRSDKGILLSQTHAVEQFVGGAVDIMATWLRQKVVYVRQTLP